MRFWWDDAIAVAVDLATKSGIRHQVVKVGHWWTVRPVTAPVRVNR